MSVAISKQATPLTQMNRTIRSVHKRIRRTSDRYTRLIRIIVKRADKRLYNAS